MVTFVLVSMKTELSDLLKLKSVGECNEIYKNEIKISMQTQLKGVS